MNDVEYGRKGKAVALTRQKYRVHTIRLLNNTRKLITSMIAELWIVQLDAMGIVPLLLIRNDVISVWVRFTFSPKSGT